MKFNIEIAPREYHAPLKYDEVQFYCFSLNIDGKSGWRMPTYSEYYHHDLLYCWWVGVNYHPNEMKRCIPVRDIINEI